MALYEEDRDACYRVLYQLGCQTVAIHEFTLNHDVITGHFMRQNHKMLEISVVEFYRMIGNWHVYYNNNYVECEMMSALECSNVTYDDYLK
jgi:hypothetical protein